MGFDAILGQEAAIGTLRRALASGRVHHAYRFEGPDGVGKEMAALAFAQALVCTAPPPPGHALSSGCGRCSACTRAGTFSQQPPRVPMHPDVVFLERGLYPVETIRRTRPETQDLSVDQVRRLVLERASFPPHEGRARVFIIRRAEELSISAANALLKTLEEPLQATYFVLLTCRGNELLTTIRSRTQLVRFAPLAEATVRSIVEKQGIAAETAQAVAELSGGSVTAALELADPKATAEREAFLEAVFGAVRAPDLSAALRLAETPGSRPQLLLRLAALANRLAQSSRSHLANQPQRAVAAARAYEIVTRSMAEVERNASPALVLEAMVTRLRSSL